MKNNIDIGTEFQKKKNISFKMYFLILIQFVIEFLNILRIP